jgi:hypothetical protein
MDSHIGPDPAGVEQNTSDAARRQIDRCVSHHHIHSRAVGLDRNGWSNATPIRDWGGPALFQPYSYDGLAPHMSRETLEYHHDKHHLTFVNSANNLIKGTEFDEGGKAAEPNAVDPSSGLGDCGEQSIASFGTHRRFCGGRMKDAAQTPGWSRPMTCVDPMQASPIRPEASRSRVVIMGVCLVRVFQVRLAESKAWSR